MSRIEPLFVTALAGILCLGLGVASVQAGEETAAQNTTSTENEASPAETSDPLEPLNRFTSGFNSIFRKVIADPLISTYKAVTPDPVEKGIANFAKNLSEPVSAASSLLEGDTENASKSMGRFIVNTTAGLGGLNDTATDLNMTANEEDLGQAAGVHGVGGGAHIVLPILGPSNMRDVTGDVLTTLVNPLHAATSAANATTTYAENRDDINALTKDAVDPYIVERDAYEQNRQYKIDNGEARFIDIPDFEDEEKNDNVSVAKQ